LKPPDEASTLSESPKGAYRCGRVRAQGVEALRIKRMGLCEGIRVEVLGTGDPMIVRVGDSRLGLSRFLARKIEVLPLSNGTGGGRTE